MQIRDTERRLEREQLQVQRLERGERAELTRVSARLREGESKVEITKKTFSDVIKHIRAISRDGRTGGELLQRVGQSLPSVARQFSEAKFERAKLLAARELSSRRLSSLGEVATRTTEKLRGVDTEKRLATEETELEEISQTRFAAARSSEDFPIETQPGFTTPELSVPSFIQRPQSQSDESPEIATLDPTADAQVEELWRRGDEEGMRVSAEVGGEEVQILLSDHQRRKLAVEIEAETPSGAVRIRRRKRRLEGALRDAGINGRVEVR